jgi:two-component system sensor histidine kinase ChiS
MKLFLRQISLACSLSLSVACSGKSALTPVRAATADLSTLRFEEREPLPLNGEWEYYPNTLLRPEEITAHTHVARLAHVPGNMHSYTDTGLITTRPGVATYRLQILLPPKLALYSLRLPALPSALRCYVNGTLQAEIGKLSSDPTKAFAATRVQYLQLPLAGKTELLLQVFNADYPTGGITQPILFSTSSQMESYRLRRTSEEIFVIVALVILGIYHIVFALLRHPERAAVFFGIFCTLTGIGRLFNGETLIDVLIPHYPWELKIRTKLAIDCLEGFFLLQYIRYFFTDLVRCPALRHILWLPVLFTVASVILPITLAVESRFYYKQ